MHSRCFGLLVLLVGDRTLDGFQEVVLRLQYVIDVVHPLAILFGRLRLQQEAGVAAMRIGAAQLETILTRHRCDDHFVDLRTVRELFRNYRGFYRILYVRGGTEDTRKSKSHLHMGPVDVRRIRELRLLADNVRKDDVLLEEEDLQLTRLRHNAGVAVRIGRIFGAQ